MPKSKRVKIEKHGKEHKEALISQIREACEEFTHIWIFSVDNMRNSFFKDIRAEWKGKGRFFQGKNKIMQIALGLSEESEVLPGIHSLSQRITGAVGLLFTSAPIEEVKQYFAEFERADYARGGTVATETFVLKEGQIMLGEDPFPASMETQLRSLGVASILKGGKVLLGGDHVVCEEGNTLTHEQARLLKMFYKQMSVFKVTLQCYYNNGAVTEVQ